MAFYLGNIYPTQFSADLTGLKVVVYGSVTAEQIEAAGGYAVVMPTSEIYTALQTGVVDAVAAATDSDLIGLQRLLGEDFTYQDVGGDTPADTPTEGNDDLSGTSGRDSIHLLGGDDTYAGLGGHDKIWGDAGIDMLKGNGGRDQLWGNAGADKLLGGRGGDRLFGGGDNDKLFGNAGADYLNGGGGNDTLLGGGGRDVLDGGNGRDHLKGGDGNDELNGARGNDTMTGNKGADIFIFNTYGQKNHDTITDFRKGVDTIRLDDGDYSIGKSGGNVVLRFGGGESLTLEGVTSKKHLVGSIDAPAPTPVATDSNPALIFDLEGKFDKSLNEAAYIGAEAWADRTGNSYNGLELQFEAQREQALNRFAEAGYSPIIMAGSSFATALANVAPNYADASFAIIDAVVDQPNVSSYTFSEHEGAYLMGIFAAMASESDTVGFIGGMDVPMTRRYSTAFEQGVLDTNPDATVLVSMTGTTPAAWNDPVKGSELAHQQISVGADVIFAAAGGTGAGVLQAVADANILGIGADCNLNYLHPGNILTSMVKRVDAVVDMIMTKGTGIVPGQHELGIAEGAIGYAFDDYNKDLLTAQMRAVADAAIEDIASGAIVVHDYYDDMLR